MSTSTQLYFEPVYEPEPQTYQASGQHALPLDSILGPGGTELLRKTLAGLRGISSVLGEAAASQLDWSPVPGRGDCYATTVDGVGVELDLSSSFARISYKYQITSSGTTPPAPSAERQQAVSRKVNELLAVAMAQRVAERLKQHVGARLRVEQRQTVNLRVSNANSFTLQASTYFTPR